MSYKVVTVHDAVETEADGGPFDVRESGLSLHFIDDGTPDGTITFEGGIHENDDIFVAVPMEKSDGTLATSTTVPGLFRLPENHGLAIFRARITAYNSGAFSAVAGIVKGPRKGG
jgi:hypothetical protein